MSAPERPVQDGGGLPRPRETSLPPGPFCRELLQALAASEGRRRRRKRDTTPDAIGLALKRELLERAAAEDPAADDFEGWLLERCLDAGPGSGGLQAVALSVLEEWRLAGEAEQFRAWLGDGARSDDRADAGGRAASAPAPSCPTAHAPAAPDPGEAL